MTDGDRRDEPQPPSTEHDAPDAPSGAEEEAAAGVYPPPETAADEMD